MIVALSLNPSIDRTLWIDRLERGGLNRAERVTIEASGKATNVARALHRNGVAVRLVLPLGGASGAMFRRMLSAEGLQFDTVQVQAEVRSNVSIVEAGADGVAAGNAVTKLDERGQGLSSEEVACLLRAATRELARGDWLVASGSVPPGVPQGVFADLTACVHDVGARIALDSSGPASFAALPAAPDLLKPNADELAELTGMTTDSPAEAARAARHLIDAGVSQVLASLGPHGAVLASPHGAVKGAAPCPSVVNTVGAGDAMLAGFLAAGASGVSALRNALAWARAAVQTPTTAFEIVQQADHDAVTVECLDEVSES